MKIPKRIKKLIASTVLTITMIASSLPLSVFAQDESEPKGYVTVTVEKFTLGLGYIEEPMKVPFYEGDTYADITHRLLGEENMKYTGAIDDGQFYLSSIQDNDTREANVPDYILDECGAVDGRQKEGWLGEFDYTSMSGWMYAVDNTFPNVGAGQKQPESGDVCRWQFTVYGYGADIGADGFGAGEPFIDVANKDDLTEEIAEINSATNKEDILSESDIKEAYEDAYEVLENAESSQSEVNQAHENLNEVLDGVDVDYPGKTEDEEDSDNSNPDVPGDSNTGEEMPDDSTTVISPKLPVNESILKSSKYMYNATLNPVIGTSSGDWTILSLARGGYNVEDGYYDKYYKNVEDEVVAKAGVLHTAKYTEYSRVILGLTSIGKDPTDVGGYNLVEKLADYNGVKKQGINGPIFALIALDSNNYEIPKVEEGKVQATRDNLIEYILDKEITQTNGTIGGWALSGKVPDPDITAMALQALSTYKNDTIIDSDGNEVEVKPYIDRAVNVLSDIQLENGGYKSWGSENVESASQVLVALTALGIDPKTDERFIKGDGNWLISNIMEYQTEDGGFAHVKNSGTNAIATDQATYSLVAYKRFVEGKNKLYDMTDAFKKNEEVNPESNEVLLSAPAKISGKKDTEFNIVLKSGAWPKGEFKLLDAVMDIPSSVSIEGVEVSKNLTGGSPNFGVENDKLRLVYTNTNLDNISFEEGDLITLKCKLKEDIKDSINFKINELNLKSDSENTVKMNVDKASVSLEIGESSGGDGGGGDDGSETAPTPELVSVKELYKGDGTDLIPNDKKAIAISFLNVEKEQKISFGDDVKLYYSEEFTNKLSNTTYIILADGSVSESDLNNINNYNIEDKEKSETILLGDTDNSDIINAQDALNTLTAWLRKSEAPDNKGILTMNVTGDSKIDTSDVISVMEKYIKDQDFVVLSK